MTELKDRVADYLQDCDKSWYRPHKEESIGIIKDQQSRIEGLEAKLAKLDSNCRRIYVNS